MVVDSAHAAAEHEGDIALEYLTVPARFCKLDACVENRLLIQGV